MTYPTWELPVADNQASLVLTPCPGTKGTPLPESIAHPLCIRHSAAVKKSLCIAWAVRVVLAYWPRICCWKKVGRWKASLLRCKH